MLLLKAFSCIIQRDLLKFVFDQNYSEYMNEFYLDLIYAYLKKPNQ